ncbi:chelonianin, partial [Terrapene carolina triunguis]|uniref:chelonianin n=1 Tax=Terrapene triunguis TaxID=2587831 RepID=UPI000CEFF8AD
MESGSIFLLLGLLAVWAELQAVAGQGDKRDICRLPPEKGPCKGKMPRFFYNPASKTCESFIYGGCQGNKNNFKTKAECVRACRPPERPGVCPKTTGPDICLHGCDSDSDCKEGQKCCFNGCGYTCVRVAPSGESPLPATVTPSAAA